MRFNSVWHTFVLSTNTEDIPAGHSFSTSKSSAQFAQVLKSYVVGSKSFRPDIQKPRQMENAVRDI